jgi:hypothetical protein
VLELVLLAVLAWVALAALVAGGWFVYHELVAARRRRAAARRRRARAGRIGAHQAKSDTHTRPRRTPGQERHYSAGFPPGEWLP